MDRQQQTEWLISMVTSITCSIAYESQELGPIPSQSYLLRAAEALIIQLPVGFNQPTKPDFLRADIRDVTDEICKLRKSYH